jgi:hypothetical protein
MRHWETLLEREQDGFQIILDKTWEEVHPSDCFDESAYDIREMCEDIDAGRLDWFMARARVFVEGLELGDACLGGLLYEDAREFVKDGMAEDLILDAVQEAKQRLTGLAQKFTMLAIKHS